VDRRQFLSTPALALAAAPGWLRINRQSHKIYAGNARRLFRL
jgi:hypothetical protein